VRKALGIFSTLDHRTGRTSYVDSFTCAHVGRFGCEGVVDRIPFKGPTDEAIGGYCHRCNAPVCKNCAGKPCVPTERFLEMIEKGRHYDELLGRK
jgi:hypothetical protein